MFKKIIIKFTKKDNKEITNFNTLDFDYMMHLLYQKGQILKHRIIDSNKKYTSLETEKRRLDYC